MKFDHKKILEYARICRVDKIVLPYLEANIWHPTVIIGSFIDSNSYKLYLLDVIYY